MFRKFFFEILPLSIIIGCWLCFSFIIIMASMGNWLFLSRFNDYGEGVYELFFVLLTSPLVVYYFFNKIKSL